VDDAAAGAILTERKIASMSAVEDVDGESFSTVLKYPTLLSGLTGTEPTDLLVR